MQKIYSARGRLPDGQPNPIDTHVGQRMRLRRNLLGLSQEKLASLLGLTFQQVQKYERGMNRISCSRLWDISQVLDVPVDFFFQDMDKSVTNQSPRMFHVTESVIEEEQPGAMPWDPMSSQEAIELVTAYYKIKNRQIARHIFNLVKELEK